LSADGEASWVTVTVLSGTPVPETVIVAVLGLASVFSELAVTVIIWSLEPLAGDTVNQLASSVIAQLVSEVRSNVPLDPEVEPIVILAGATVNVFDGVPEASWVTITVLSDTPVPETVIVAVLGLASVFSELAVTVIIWSLEPLAGDTVNQLASSAIAQLVSEVRSNVPFDPEAEPIVIVAGDTVNVFDGVPVL